MSSIPANAVITSATLSLWTANDLSDNNRTIRVFRLKTAFNESEATWNIASTGVNWQTAGASGANDREGTDIGSVQILANEAIGVEKQISLTPAQIQEMVNGTFTNNGFILVADTELNDRFNYKSSDSTTAAQRPKLVVQYTTATPTPTPTPTLTPTASPTPTATLPVTLTPSPTFTSTPAPSGPITINYVYDPLYRLTNATYSDGRSFGYAYDPVGSVLQYSRTINSQTVISSYNYNGANQLTTAQESNSPILWSYVYDNNGSLTEILPNGVPADGARRYTYNTAGYLVRAETHAGASYQPQADMLYNGLGQRLSMTAYAGGLNVITNYALDPMQNARPLIATSGGNTTVYLYGLDPLAELTTAWSYSLPDGTGTPRQLTDNAGQITLAGRYTPWGDSLDYAGTGNFTFGYFGGLMDSATGLLYVGNGQYYDPATGRFLTRNVNPNTTNPYVPWGNPTGAILAPLALIGLIYGRKRKKNGFDYFVIVLFVALGVGAGLAACGPAPVPSNGSPQPPSVPPASPSTPDIPVSTPSPAPVVQPSSTSTSILDQIFATPCPEPTFILPFTNDNSWGNNWVQKQQHWDILRPLLESYQGEKWWEGSLPTTEEWTAYLVYTEGGILTSRDDKKLLAWILLYKIPRWGVAEYTPVTNPIVNTAFEYYNFTMDDWNKLINPDIAGLQEGFTILQETLSIHNSNELPPYLYWVSKDEIEKAEEATGQKIKFEYQYKIAGTVDGKYLFFLQAIEDFRKVFP